MQKIRDVLKQVFENKFVKDLGIVFSENIITKLINFIIILMLTRFLGAEDYGKYSFIFVAMAFINGISDFGMENTSVRFSVKEKDFSNSVFGIYLFLEMLILALISLILIIFGKSIFYCLHKIEIVVYIPYLIIGLFSESLMLIINAYFQAIQCFKLRATINIFRYIISLGFVWILFINKLFLLKYVFCLYFIPLGVSLIFITKYLKFLYEFFNKKLPKNLLCEIINYQKWMLNLSVANNILSRIDFLMLSFWANYSQLGIYNAAFQLSSVVSFLPYVFGKVMLPKTADLERKEIIIFTKKVLKFLIIPVVLIIFAIPTTKFIVPMLLGSEYIKSIGILQILLLAFIVSFITTPFEQAFYSMGKPAFLSAGRYIQIFAIILLNFYMIPRYGAISAAYNVLITRIFFLVIISFAFFKDDKKEIGMEESYGLQD